MGKGTKALSIAHIAVVLLIPMPCHFNLQLPSVLLSTLELLLFLLAFLEHCEVKFVFVHVQGASHVAKVQ